MKPITIIMIVMIMASFLVFVLGYLGIGPLSMVEPTDPLYIPQTDCIGSWSPCEGSADDSAIPCKKTYTITTQGTDKGDPCPFTDKKELTCDFTSSTGGDCAGSSFAQCAMGQTLCSTHHSTPNEAQANTENITVDCQTSAADSLCSSTCSMNKAKIEDGVACQMKHTNGKSYLIQMNSYETVQTGTSSCATGWTMIDPASTIDTQSTSAAKSVCAKFVESGGTVDNKCDAGQSIQEETGNCIQSDCPSDSHVHDGSITFIPDPDTTTLAWGTGTPLAPSTCILQPWANNNTESTTTMYCEWDKCWLNPATSDATAHCCCVADVSSLSPADSSSPAQFAKKCPFEGDAAALQAHNLKLDVSVINIEGISWIDSNAYTPSCLGEGDSSMKECKYSKAG